MTDRRSCRQRVQALPAASPRTLLLLLLPRSTQFATAPSHLCPLKAYEDATGKTSSANKEAFRAAMVRAPVVLL